MTHKEHLKPRVSDALFSASSRSLTLTQRYATIYLSPDIFSERDGLMFLVYGSVDMDTLVKIATGITKE